MVRAAKFVRELKRPPGSGGREARCDVRARLYVTTTRIVSGRVGRALIARSFCHAHPGRTTPARPFPASQARSRLRVRVREPAARRGGSPTPKGESDGTPGRALRDPRPGRGRPPEVLRRPLRLADRLE